MSPVVEIAMNTLLEDGGWNIITLPPTTGAVRPSTKEEDVNAEVGSGNWAFVATLTPMSENSTFI
jgi:hypothetical protein